MRKTWQISFESEPETWTPLENVQFVGTNRDVHEYLLALQVETGICHAAVAIGDAPEPPPELPEEPAAPAEE